VVRPGDSPDNLEKSCKSPPHSQPTTGDDKNVQQKQRLRSQQAATRRNGKLLYGTCMNTFAVWFCFTLHRLELLIERHTQCFAEFPQRRQRLARPKKASNLVYFIHSLPANSVVIVVMQVQRPLLWTADSRHSHNEQTQSPKYTDDVLHSSHNCCVLWGSSRSRIKEVSQASWQPTVHNCQ